MSSSLCLRVLLRPFLVAAPSTLRQSSARLPNKSMTPRWPALAAAAAPWTRVFSATAQRPAPATKPTVKGNVTRSKLDAKKITRKQRKQKKLEKPDPKVAGLMSFLAAPQTIAPPLRMGRNRWLRHWTIHRAWLLLRRKRREQREREMMQAWQSMRDACEELRVTSGPGTVEQGYLYRVAMEKKGVWQHGGVPIDYAKPMVETPPTVAWNHDWTP